jgi:hypothetical protein
MTASQPSSVDGRPDRRSLCLRAKRALECGGLTPLSAVNVDGSVRSRMVPVSL